MTCDTICQKYQNYNNSQSENSTAYRFMMHAAMAMAMNLPFCSSHSRLHQTVETSCSSPASSSTTTAAATIVLFRRAVPPPAEVILFLSICLSTNRYWLFSIFYWGDVCCFDFAGCKFLRLSSSAFGEAQSAAVGVTGWFAEDWWVLLLSLITVGASFAWNWWLCWS